MATSEKSAMSITTALSLLIALLREAAELSRVIQEAKEAGRDDLTEDEVQMFAVRAQLSLDQVQAKIDALQPPS